MKGMRRTERPSPHRYDSTSPDQSCRAHSAFPLAVAVLVVVVAVLAAHWPVLSAGAVSFDDTPYLFENPVLQRPSWTSVATVLREVLGSSTVKGYYEPLTLISLMLDVTRGGTPENLRPFHVTSLALHAINTASVIILLCVLLGGPRPGTDPRDAQRRRTASLWAAGAAGLLFGLHPMTVEPVAWVWERKTVLATFFAVWCLILYAGYTRRGSRAAYGAALALFVLALMAKPTVTPVPVLLLLLDFWPLRRLNRRAVWEKIPFFIIAGVFAVITIVSTGRTGAVTLPADRTLLQVPLKVGYLMVFYLGKIIWPVNLSSVYVLPEPMALGQPRVLLGLLGTCLLAALLVLSLRWTRAVLTGGLFFAAALAPTLGVIGYSWVNASDKYVYFPAVGPLMVLAWAWIRAWEAAAPQRSRRKRTMLVAVLALAAVAEAVATRRYIALWRDTETLFTYMLRLTPDVPGLHNSVGVALASRGAIAEAIRHFKMAITLFPRFAAAHDNLGFALAQDGRTDEAIDHFHEALRIEPDYARAHVRLAAILAKKRRFDEAVAHYLRALRVKPNDPAALNNLGVVLDAQGRHEEAIAHYRRALAIDPCFGEAHRCLGLALARQGHFDMAVGHLTKAAHLCPGAPDTWADLADVLVGRGQDAEAATHYARALELKPDHLRALNNLAWLYATRPGLRADAGLESVRLAENACRLCGRTDAGAMDTLAAAYASVGRFVEAVDAARTALYLARTAGQEALAEDIAIRLQTYMAGRPWRHAAQRASSRKARRVE